MSGARQDAAAREHFPTVALYGASLMAGSSYVRRREVFGVEDQPHGGRQFRDDLGGAFGFDETLKGCDHSRRPVLNGEVVNRGDVRGDPAATIGTEVEKDLNGRHVSDPAHPGDLIGTKEGHEHMFAGQVAS